MTYDILQYGSGFHYLCSQEMDAKDDAEAKDKARGYLGKGKAPISPASTVRTVQIVRDGCQTVGWQHLD